MSIQDPIILEVDQCECGRRADKMHCIYCGSFVFYALMKKEVERIDPFTGELIKYQVFRCRHCGKYFDKYQVEFDDCTAPKVLRRRSIRSTEGRKTARVGGIKLKLRDPLSPSYTQSLRDKALNMADALQHSREKQGLTPLSAEEYESFVVDAIEHLKKS